ncbi:MAG: LiaF domain-containing protein [Bacteroidota bacterium]
MTNDINNINTPKKPGKGNVIAGIILLMIGVSFLLNQFDFGLPHWLFGWYTWIIAVGLYMGTRSNFRSLGWLVVTAVGFAFMLNDALPHVAISKFYWPAALIGFGIYLILRRKNHTDYWDKKEWNHKWDAGKFNYRAPGVEPVVDYRIKTDEGQDATTPPPVDTNPETEKQPNFAPDDFLDAVSIFGGVKKIVFSKNFQGGELVNVFGGAELDFTQADINGRVYVDVTQIFGGTKIIVPAHWMVVSDMSAVFAGVDDKRMRTNTPLDSNKVLVLKGISVFAGIDIRSY